MHTVRRTLEGVGILLACVYVAWLAFIDPTYLALNDDDPLLIAALAVSITAALFFAACVAYSTLTKLPNERRRAGAKVLTLPQERGRPSEEYDRLAQRAEQWRSTEKA